MNFVRGRYSWLIRPMLVAFDVFIVALIAMVCFKDPIDIDYFLLYQLLSWLTIAFSLSFYEVYRFTSVLKIFSLLGRQYLLFSITTFAYFGFFRDQQVSAIAISTFLSVTFLAIATFKLGIYFLLRKYRSVFGGNFRNVVIIGNNSATHQLESFFKKKKDLGYNLIDVFENSADKSALEELKKLNGFPIDEIYCALDDVNDDEIDYYIQYADTHQCNLKFIPTTQKFFAKKLKTDYYEYQPVLSLPEPAINQPISKFVKRMFDFCFSLIVIIFILSWMMPLFALLIKLNSKGPVFYKHKRHGINYKEFWCYKFRTLSDKNKDAEKPVTKDDNRVTSIGKILRRSSLDEFPQFFNVLLGNMSVVGPRPHMIGFTKTYAKKLDKLNFVFRHSVKPGITGLAQVKGYRGEISTDEELINRFKYDVFYIENWSLLLDFRIITQTVVNIYKGDEKAY
ncbi:MAG: exopolysaccharide biosynthesis polyprenyl glycosylphosphotransferase [Flavobacteriaceae bacterium]|nr:exopolysaccharide biosynthesis polyprenyl glycosylphosphotransferase [Flavobacteriaceae bacterium]MDZ4146992.1 exopolysaccharide biosynthesis polyprenyl glycosylphosphotransferase [Flavobacteriaceae bacterium]